MEQRELHCGDLIKRISDIMEREGNQKMQALDITHAQMKMLLILYHTQDGSATLKELERYFHVAQSTTAGIAARLEKKRLLEGYGDPQDRRVKHVRITQEGRKLCLNAREIMEEGERRLLAGLDGQEQQQLKALLQKVYNTLK
ncbi:MAG: MarR family transcriptional regulator [Eubacteriales bacterium]|nr:MarR family transcriptional regulator [Eubacteriales bacterium]